MSESKKNEKQTISREQVVLWAMDSGFNPGFVRLNVRDFEKFAYLVEHHVNSELYKGNEEWHSKQ